MIVKRKNQVLSLLQIAKTFFFIIISFISYSCDKDEIYPWNEDSLNNILDQNLDKMILVDFETEW